MLTIFLFLREKIVSLRSNFVERFDRLQPR